MSTLRRCRAFCGDTYNTSKLLGPMFRVKILGQETIYVTSPSVRVFARTPMFTTEERLLAYKSNIQRLEGMFS